jgi:hypothetical protein
MGSGLPKDGIGGGSGDRKPFTAAGSYAVSVHLDA